MLSDLLELLSSWGSVKPISPSPKNADLLGEWIERYSSSAICLRENDQSKLNYLSWPFERKLDAANRAVANWVSRSFDSGSFLVE
jgi:hypothetical protein